MICWYKIASENSIISVDYINLMNEIMKELYEDELINHNRIINSNFDIDTIIESLKDFNDYPEMQALNNAILNQSKELLSNQIARFFNWVMKNKKTNYRNTIKLLWDYEYYSNSPSIPDKNQYELQFAKIISGTIKNANEKLDWINKRKPQSITIQLKIILPIIKREDNNYLESLDTFYVVLGETKNDPGFTIFPDNEIDDVLEGDEDDFFISQEVQNQYMQLISALQNNEGKTLTLYTARPSSDRSIYQSTSSVPINIFLTTKEDSAIGYAIDFGNRDLWRIRINSKYLICTLNTPSEKNYQVIAPEKGGIYAPVEDIVLVQENV